MGPSHREISRADWEASRGTCHKCGRAINPIADGKHLSESMSPSDGIELRTFKCPNCKQPVGISPEPMPTTTHFHIRT